MAKDEWTQPDKIGVHPTLVKLAEKTKELINHLKYIKKN